MTDPPLAPKIELHCHLEATMSEDFLDELARRHDRPGLRSCASQAFTAGHDLAAYLDGYDAGARLLVDAEDFAEAIFRHLDCLGAQNVIYTELFWSPMVHLGDGVAYSTQLAGLVSGIEQSSSGVACRLIPAINRERPVRDADLLLDDILADRHELIVGLGLDYDELLGPASAFTDVFARARRAGLAATSHAGETAPAQSILDSIELLGCSRIDHGYAVLADDHVAQRCRDAGTTFTVSTRAAQLLEVWGVDAPATPAQMWAAGLRISPTTDAPAHFHTSLTDEYQILADRGADLRQLALDSVDAAFLDHSDRESLRRRVVSHQQTPASTFGSRT